ncbi:L-idonate 5-dehydrogenase (NAD(P)(+)) [Rhodobacteraceae bacterium THAF1]|uniref:L-idonate 5-dehydrogenase n=1 Tax=Palleronia sp. THAF1 TaxID=2587842 RepID=UPI000F3CC55B|nr:L-idonate 5-dehydrogenase [Palleronia sp. THAF1]QFU08983.1 L-idonate 5-dehydrogenase (NAD(P)(+)) [Palleronia sp. THAF1]VDC24278.1 L-idonate 5-dehydrogenase (NAD(P)(+)) [Rhodobacteraceae bacterium THAF1]
MKSIVIHDAKDLRVEDRQAEEPGPGQVQIRLAAGGICGSDLHYYNHGGFGTVRLKEPMILGHEVSGFVAKVGEGVKGLTEGQLVAVSPSRPCGHCRYCREAMFNQCLNMRFYGSAMPFPHIQGAFREVLVTEAGQCAPADGLTPGQAAMAEPLAVALHAVQRVGPLLGKSVLVTGCGPIGILCILAARRAGADLIVATDLSDFTLGMARTAGADVTVAAGQDALSDYEAEKGTFDVLFECSGAVPALVGAIPAMRPGGTIMQLGLGGDMTLPVQAMTAKELALKGSFRFHDEFFTGVSLMQKGLIDVQPFITQTFALDDAVAAFDAAGDRNTVVKAQIKFADE